VTRASKIASPRAKPLMIYDGGCNFCKFWIIRWQRATAGRVDFLASQDERVAREFPRLPRENFEQSVQFIETDGRVYSGAEAVFRALTYSRFWGWCFGFYRDLPGVKPVTEGAYRFVARRREGFSFLTRLLWGRDGALPEYHLVRWVFLRLLGVIYLSAFMSLGSQISGLLGSDGILPAKNVMAGAQVQFAQQNIGLERYHILPTLCWFSASDGFLRGLCLAGTVLSLLLIFNFAPAVCLFLLWLIYLSLVSVGRDFLSFQWDVLLLEAGFLAIFFAPLQFLPRSGITPRASCAILWLLRWLLFRLMFESGVVKLLSGDAHWSGLTALNFHYETQPLPTWIGWYAHQLPGGFQSVCVFIMFVIELGVPFLIFAPRRLRFFGCGLLALLQLCILLTGNYCFFNLLTLALCLLLLDDALLRKLFPRRRRQRWFPQSELNLMAGPETGEKALGEIQVPPAPMFDLANVRNWPQGIIATITIVILLLSVTQVVGMLVRAESWPAPLALLDGCMKPFRSVNTYGLFAVMTTSREEIILEGSNDGKTWVPYEFKYKPGDPHRRPSFVAPYQPRLDWQMWFAALGNYQQNRWLVNCCIRLLQGSPEVLELLGHNPFPNTPPRYIHAVVYDYHFSNWQARREQGIWWRRELKGEYLPVISLSENH
jgi:lipase maturation factor 1